MTKQTIAGTGQEGLPISEAVRAGDFVFVSGMVGVDPDGKIVSGGIIAETERILTDLADVLKKCGATLSHVVKTTVYLSDSSDFVDFNQTYAKYFRSDPPARVSLITSLTIEAKIGMDFVAYLGR